MTVTEQAPSYRELVVSAPDGVRLYARDYGPSAGDALPVVCLPGLARTSEDFHELALSLAGEPLRPRRVLSLDYRGRGRSGWDPDWRNYDVKVELGDTLHVLEAAGIRRAVFVGTSRGGLITMALSGIRPDLIAGAVLNDVGPVLDRRGLMRIKSYVGRLPTPRTMAEAVEVLRAQSGSQFPRYTDKQWTRMARGTWHATEAGLVLNYDPALANVLAGLDDSSPLPDLWPLFEAMKPFPVLAIRGALSDLLAAETLQAMQERHPGLEAVTVPDQGHAPSVDGATLGTIGRFIAAIDRPV